MPPTDLTVLLAQSGDRSALGQLLRAYQAPLFRYLCRLLRNRADAEDCLQDTFVQIVRKISHLREPAVFKDWAFRIASRAAYRRVSRAGRAPPAVALDEIAAIAVGDDETALAQRIDAARLLAGLSPASRVVAYLHHIEGWSLKDIAIELGVPLGTVKSRLAYAKRPAS